MPIINSVPRNQLNRAQPSQLISQISGKSGVSEMGASGRRVAKHQAIGGEHGMAHHGAMVAVAFPQSANHFGGYQAVMASSYATAICEIHREVETKQLVVQTSTDEHPIGNCFVTTVNPKLQKSRDVLTRQHVGGSDWQHISRIPILPIPLSKLAVPSTTS